MQFDPKAIANFFLQAAKSENRPLTPLKVIKLVYIAHGWHLGLTGEPLINEHPEAWKYGPVIPSLYHEFKIYGSEPVTKPATEVVENNEDDWSFEIREVNPPAQADTVTFLTKVWDAYKKFSGTQLSGLTHQSETPWSQTWARRGKYSKGVDIPEPLIREHYQQLSSANALRQAA